MIDAPTIRPPAGQRAARNSFLLALIFGVSTFSGALTSVLLAYLLTVEELGIYGTWFRLFAWLSMLSAFLLPPVLVRYTAELTGAGNHREAWRLLRAALFVEAGIVSLLLVGLLVYGITGGPHSAESLVAMALVALSTVTFGFSQVLESHLRGIQRFGPITRAAVWAAILRVLGLMLLWILGAGVIEALVVYAAGLIVSLLVVLSATLRSRPRRETSSSARPVFNLRRRVIEYGGAMGTGGMLSLVIWHYPEVFLLNWMWKGRAELSSHLACYTLAISLTAFPLRLGKILSGSLLPAFSDLYGSGEIARVAAGYRRATVLSAMVGVPVALFSIAMAPAIVVALFPEGLRNTVVPFQLMMIPAVLLALHQAGSAAQPALEGHRFLLVSTALLAPACLAMGFFLIPTHGAVGAAMVNAFGQGTAVLSGIYYVAFRRNLGFPLASVARIFLTSLPVAIGLYAACIAVPEGRSWALAVLIIGGGLGLLLYASLLRVSGVLGKDERRGLAVAIGGIPAALRPFAIPAARLMGVRL